MGYRSSGKIWLPEETRALMSDELKTDLLETWDKDEDTEDVWTFDYWKWYEGYEDVDRWNEFYYEMENQEMPIDLVVVGEDNAIVHEPNYSKFEVVTRIHIMG